MSLKIKLASAIIMFLAVLAALVIGVLAAQSQTINMQGTINFEIADRSLYVKSASIDYGDGQERALDSFMPGYINGSFTANIGEHTITNTNFKICFDIINTTENTYYALEETTLSSELQGKITATASGTINPTTITDFDEEGNAIITPDTETNGRVTITVSAPSLLTLDLSGITITIEEAKVLEGFIFIDTSDNTGGLYRYNGSESNVVIPSSYSIRQSDGAFIEGSDYTVTSIYDGNSGAGGSDYAFVNATSTLQSITIPSSIEKIGAYAFYGCGALTTVIFEENSRLTSIGESAFSGCSQLQAIEIPNSVTSMGNGAFSGCSQLQAIEIPNSVTSMGRSAFSSCSALTTVIFEENGQLTSIEDTVFNSCTQLQTLELPNSVTSIGLYAFQDCSQLQSIEIPSSVTNITEYAFDGCTSLTTVTFEENSQITNIDRYAFGQTNSTIQYNEYENGQYLGSQSNPYLVLIGTTAAYNITQFTIHENCQLIAGGVLSSRTSLQSIELPAGVKGISDSAFYRCSQLQSIELPAGLISIGDSAFYTCSRLSSVTIPSSVTNIGRSAFNDCTSLTTVTFENGSSLESIGQYAFQGCSQLQSIEMPASVISIGDYAFQNCTALSTVTFEENSCLTSIGERAFQLCTQLQSIEIPSSIESIEDAFGHNDALQYNEYDNGQYLGNESNPYLVLVDTTTTDFTQITINKNCKIICSYALSGCTFTTVIFEENSILKSIERCAFQNCSQLSSIEIPSSVISIGENAFSGCSTLGTITFEGNSQLTSIGDNAFQNCRALESIEIPAGVTSIGRSAFSSCSSLTTVTFEENSRLTSIGEIAFSGCSQLQAIEIPNSVTSIGYSAFGSCTSLTTVTFEENSQLTSLVGTFSGCSALESIEIPSSVIEIDFAFNNCTSLATVTFEENSRLASIKQNAFSGCSALTSIELPLSLVSIGQYSFYNCTSLQTITIPSNVIDINEYSVFANCTSLTAINVAEGNQNYLSENGILFNKDKKTLIAYPAGKTETTYEIPSTVTSIGSSAFMGCSALESIELPNGLISIGDSAFQNCTSLESIEIPSSVTSIGGSAFFNCTSLTTVIIDSREIYIAATSQWACGNLLGNSSTTTVRVLKSIVDGGAVNSYITSNFTNTSKDGNYYVYTK